MDGSDEPRRNPLLKLAGPGIKRKGNCTALSLQDFLNVISKWENEAAETNRRSALPFADWAKVAGRVGNGLSTIAQMLSAMLHAAFF